MRKKGFTLIELLVVIAIIAMLLAIVVPAIRKAKEVAKRVICGSGMRQTLIGLKTYGETYDGKLIPMADVSGGGGDVMTGIGITYSDNRGSTPWSSFYPWEGAVAHAARAFDTVQVPKSKAYHLGVLYELNIVTNPEVFYCPAQPMHSVIFNLPYRYEAYTDKGGCEWGSYCPNVNNPNSGIFIRTSYNYWVHEKIRWTELNATKIVLVDNLQDWNAIPHRKASATSSPQGVSAGFADGHVSFCVNDSVFKKTAMFNDVALWPGCDTERTDDGPGNITASFKALLTVLSQSQ